jgi:PadR family transcriptional regulator, regulatory protein PadR
MILLAVLRVGAEAYGVPIAREIEQTAGRPVALAAVYAVLDRLERRGLVRSSLGQATPRRGGRARRLFEVTVEGLRAVTATQRALIAMWTNVPELNGSRI